MPIIRKTLKHSTSHYRYVRVLSKLSVKYNMMHEQCIYYNSGLYYYYYFVLVLSVTVDTRAGRLFKGIWKSVEITFSKWLIVGNYHETVKFIVGILSLLRIVMLTDVMNST